MENNKRVSDLIRRKNFEKSINVLNAKLQMFLENESYKIINNQRAVETIQESVYKIVKERQQLGKSLKFQDKIDSINYCKKKLPSFLNNELYTMLRIEEQYIVIEISLEHILNYLEELFQTSIGDLVIVSEDYLNGLCLESNHYYKRVKFEVTFWSND